MGVTDGRRCRFGRIDAGAVTMAEDRVIDSKWKKAKDLATAFNMKVNALGQRAKNIMEAHEIAAEKGITIPGISDWLIGVQDLQSREVRVARVIADVMTGRLGLRRSERVSGDIDVMARPGTTDDELAQYSFGGWVLIVIGVVVVLGLVAALWHEHTEADKSRNFYRPMYDECNRRLAGDADWEAKKQSREWALRKTTWDRLEAGADKLMGGVQTGLAIGIPIALLVLMSWLKPAKR